jgi:uncharacterized protein (DUF427 family)
MIGQSVSGLALGSCVIMMRWNATSGQTKTFSRQNRRPILPIALWMSRAVVLYSRPDHCKAADQKRLITMKLPGPDHPITITANPKRVRVLAGGVVIADTTHALTLKEASYPAVQYVPRSDANLALLTRTDRVTHCPYKGDANYFSVNADGKTIENSIWTYETPFPAMAEISGHLAFYPDKVRIEEMS